MGARLARAGDRVSFGNATCPICRRPYLTSGPRDPGCPTCPPRRVPTLAGQQPLFELPPPASEPASSSGTRVVNLRRESFDVYIGRASSRKPPHLCDPGEEGYLGNPFPVARCGRIGAMKWFRRYAFKRLVEPGDARFRAAVESGRGKRLGCFCKDARGRGECHGDVYVEWLETGTIVIDPPAPSEEEPVL